jgi:hypothetical protein
MCKKIGQILEKICGKGCKPECMIMTTTRSLTYFGLGVALTGLILLNSIGAVGLIIATIGFIAEICYLKQSRKKKK